MFQLKSTNPNLSYVISKNPNTQIETNAPFSRSLRKGNVHGWFASDTEFRCMFIDSPTETSFIDANGDFEYLDRSRYNCPYLPVAVINELLRSASRARHELDTTGFQHEIVFPIELKRSGIAKQLARHMPGGIDLHQVGVSSYIATARSDVGIYDVLNAVQVFCMTQTMLSKDFYLPISLDVCVKYASALKAINAPYYARYTFSRMVQSPKTFNAVRDVLVSHPTQKIEMNFGDTWMHRSSKIETLFENGDTMWDIGCGELRYTRKLTRSHESVVAFDADTEIQEANKGRVEKSKLTSVTVAGDFFTDYQQHVLTAGKNFDILATEVIEHMPIEKSTELLNIVATLPFRRAVFTVPNIDFNQHYLLEGFRHNDHDWEPTLAEFTELIHGSFPSTEFNVSVDGLGDSVDGVSTSLLAVIDRISK